MEGGIPADAPLDYASFQILATENRYEAFVCYNGDIEKLASGLLTHLSSHLPHVNDLHHTESSDHFKLHLPESLKGSTWFSKSTLSRFLHIVGVPELLKNADAIGDEMFQLEEARKFHLTLYAQAHQDEAQSKESGRHNSENIEPVSKPDLQMTSADATKNELLRALNLRLNVLKEDFFAAFRQVTDGTCSYNQISDLVAFSQYFGAIDLRNSLSRYLELAQKNQNVDLQNEQLKPSQHLANDNVEIKEGKVQMYSPVAKPIIYGASPAKAAQVERLGSTDSEESSESSAEDEPYAERSRSLIRSASPRRSASPMRRVQIGRSGSRRATALTIKSLSFIPAKERVSSNQDAVGNSSDEESAQPLKKPVSNASSMSVKDAISLFERKQRDETSDLQKKRFPVDSSVNASKSVLRRWSAGMGDSSAQSQSGSASESLNETSSNNLPGAVNPTTVLEVNMDSGLTVENTGPSKTADEDGPLTTGEENPPCSVDNLTENSLTQVDESNTRATATADWNRQKQDELNLMMMKMMESKPKRNRSLGTGVSKSQELPSGLRGGFYDHYKQKRDEKLRGENSSKRAEKEEKFKTLQGLLDQKKVEMSSKSSTVAGKSDSLVKPRKSPKNPSPPLQPRKESTKTSPPLHQPKKDPSRLAAPKKISPKPSSVSSTRKSWPSGPSPKTSENTPNKTPGWVSSTGNTQTRRKSQPTPPSIQSSPKVEKTKQKPKSTMVPQTETKLKSTSQEGKKQRSVARSGNNAEAKALQTSVDGSIVVPAKPSFYNKVTKKGSVVPLESKPFLRKRSGVGPGVGPVKTKVSQSDELLSSGNLIQTEEGSGELSKTTSQKEEGADLVLPITDVSDLRQEATVNSPLKLEDSKNDNIVVSESDDCYKRTTESLEEEIQPEIESTISPTAWVEVEEHKELPVSCDSLPQIADSISIEPVVISSPRVRHSLSQMLQEDNGEPEIIEWGNAEIPPAIVYQKDVPKGFKRLLKFARKNKGDANATGWSSPSVFSDGEEDTEEPKAASKRHGDAISRRASLQSKGLRTALGASYDGSILSKSTDYTATLPSGQSNMSRLATQASEKLQEGHISAAAKPRSFFSLSTFRSSKSNETKPR